MLRGEQRQVVFSKRKGTKKEKAEALLRLRAWQGAEPGVERSSMAVDRHGDLMLLNACMAMHSL
jgi:hypothetical protein